MTSPALTTVWLQVLALLAIEAALVSGAVALLRRWNQTAAWGRLCCQAGITAVLLITAAELTGAGRGVAAWTVLAFAPSGRESARVPAQPRAGGLELRKPATTSVMSDSRTAASIIATPNLSGNEAVVMGSAGVSPAVSGLRPETSRAKDDNFLVDRSPPSGQSAGRRLERPGRSRSSLPTESFQLSDASDSYAVLWVWLVWSVGALVGLARACVARFLTALFRLRRRAVVDPALVARVQVLARSLGLRRRVWVLQSARLNSPIAFGLIHPTVGLPPDFSTRFDVRRQDAILAHELAHLAACDPFWCFLADVAAALLWWHPAVWWMRQQLHVAGELVADEASLVVADGPEALAECLVELGTHLTRQPLPGPLGVVSFRSHLGRRVQRLMHLEPRVWSPPRRFRAALFGIFGSMALVAVAIVCTAWADPRALTNGDNMKSMQLNWKRSLATFALLAAFNGPDAAATADQPNQPAAASPPESTNTAAALPASPAKEEAASHDPFGQSSGSSSGTTQVQRAADAAEPEQGAGDTPAPAALPMARTDAPDSKSEAHSATFQTKLNRLPPSERHGALLDAKLKQILLAEVSIDGLPLGEVLRHLSEQSVKLDPEKIGVNFLIDPNFPPVATFGMVDPATGLPVAAAIDTFDMSAVMVKFNLPLRHVRLKDVLDAVVKVADHPIEYTLEDYAVVFAPKPQTVEGQPVVYSHAEPAAGQNQMIANPFFASRASPMIAKPLPDAASEIEYGPVTTTPHRFNIAFGVWRPTESEQVGPAAAGAEGDFWNTVGVPWNDAHTEFGMKTATGQWSPIRVEMINLGGAWGNDGGLANKSAMLESYNYPANNKGGNSRVILHRVPPGKYIVYLYGHGVYPLYYGDYTVSVGDRNYGRKTTSRKSDAIRNTKWVEGSQYVKFSGVKIGAGENLDILIQPGGQVTLPDGRTIADAMISGLQLIPAN